MAMESLRNKEESPDDFRDPETRDLIPSQMAEADEKGIRFETVHRRKDGRRFPVEVSAGGASSGGTYPRYYPSPPSRLSRGARSRMAPSSTLLSDLRLYSSPGHWAQAPNARCRERMMFPFGTRDRGSPDRPGESNAQPRKSVRSILKRSSAST